MLFTHVVQRRDIFIASRLVDVTAFVFCGVPADKTTPQSTDKLWIGQRRQILRN